MGITGAQLLYDVIINKKPAVIKARSKRTKIEQQRSTAPDVLIEKLFDVFWRVIKVCC
jgi:hypothetical protein